MSLFLSGHIYHYIWKKFLERSVQNEAMEVQANREFDFTGRDELKINKTASVSVSCDEVKQTSTTTCLSYVKTVVFVSLKAIFLDIFLYLTVYCSCNN